MMSVCVVVGVKGGIITTVKAFRSRWAAERMLAELDKKLHIERGEYISVHRGRRSLINDAGMYILPVELG